jgi:hypothetical protein
MNHDAIPTPKEVAALLKIDKRATCSMAPQGKLASDGGRS